jgi:hypothetical protein
VEDLVPLGLVATASNCVDFPVASIGALVAIGLPGPGDVKGASVRVS